MAEKRMLSQKIVDSDVFLDMPSTTQNLYFHLNIRADDDGFVNNPKSIMRNVNASENDLSLLILKKFIIPFESGIVVIRHWKIHNYIRKDTYKETAYKEEKSRLIEKDKVYELCDDSVTDTLQISGETDVNVSQSRNEIATQNRLDKNRLDKNNNIDESKPKKDVFKDIIEMAGFKEDLTKNDLKDFIDMRKKTKKPLTERALKLIIKKLKDSTNSEKIMQKMLENAIVNNWLSVYELNEQEKSKLQNDEIKSKDYKEVDISDKEYSEIMKGNAKYE